MPYIKTADGLTFHYVVPSSDDARLDPGKQTLLLLHPRIFDLKILEPQFNCKRLSQRYNLLAVDLPWHGLTKIPMDDKIYDHWLVAKQLLRFLDALHVDKCHIFGVQIGSTLGMRMAILNHERILSLILCSAPPPKEKDQNIEQYRNMRDVCRQSAEDGTNVPQEIVNSGSWIYFGNSSYGHLFSDWLPDTNFKASNQAFLDKVFSSLTHRDTLSPEQWLDITCPVLMLHGDDDTVYPVEHAYETFEMLSKVSQKEFRVIKDAPMILSYTHATEVNELAANFLDSQGTR